MVRKLVPVPFRVSDQANQDVYSDSVVIVRIGPLDREPLEFLRFVVPEAELDDFEIELEYGFVSLRAAVEARFFDRVVEIGSCLSFKLKNISSRDRELRLYAIMGGVGQCRGG